MENPVDALEKRRDRVPGKVGLDKRKGGVLLRALDVRFLDLSLVVVGEDVDAEDCMTAAKESLDDV
jgi:hypothetical protein